MQKIIKPRCPSRQLLETVNFAFMKIFYSLLKEAIFRVFLLFLGNSRHALLLIQLWAYIVQETRYFLVRFYLDDIRTCFIIIKLTALRSAVSFSMKEFFYFWETNGTT